MSKFTQGIILIFCLLVSTATAQNIVSSIGKAPIDPTGNVAGAVTDIVINLDTSPDPRIEGRSLMEGKTIKVVLPPELSMAEDLAFGTPAACPADAKCNAVILVQGWPQKPVPFGLYSISFEAPQTIVITANKTIGPSGAGPGIKVIHLNIAGFINPAAGDYPVQVLAETGVDGALEEGTGTFTVLPEAKASINVTSILSDAPGTNLIYQETTVNQETPLPFDFLLWDTEGQPMLEVSVSEDGRSLIQNGQVVGSINVDAPAGTLRHRVYSKEPSKEMVFPISGIPTGHFRVYFLAGDLAGDYTVSFDMVDGTSQSMFVKVLDSMAGQHHNFIKLAPSTADSNGNSILANCGADYPEARASMIVNQMGDSTSVDISVTDAKPNTLYTVWLWLKATDAAGNTFGGNPLSGKSGAPFAASTDYAELLAATGSGNGVTEGANVFTTDENGNAMFSTTLDYPLFGGAWPFHKIQNFDASDPRLPIENARLYPVALVSPSASINAPFMVRIASHCSDSLSHGWAAGAREPWFDFPE